MTKDIYFYRTYLSSWSSVMCRVYLRVPIPCSFWRNLHCDSPRSLENFRKVSMIPQFAYDCTFIRLYPSRKRNTSWTRRNRWKMAEDSLPSWLAHSRHVTSLGPSPIVIEVGGRGLRLILSHLYHFLWRRWSSCLWQSWIELIMENGETVTTKSDRNILAGSFRYRTFFRQWDSWLQWGYRFALRDFEIEDVESKTISRALKL